MSSPSPEQGAPASGDSTGSAGAAGGGGSGAPNPFNSLYVGDLLPDVNEAELYDLFSRVGAVISIKLCRDIITRRSLGYAYVNYQQPSDAQRALEELNFALMHGQQMRIMYSQRDPSARKSGVGNIFVKNLDKSISSAALYDTFAQFGQIQSCKIQTDNLGNSRGYGFVQFHKQEDANEAIEKVNGMLLGGRQVFVAPFVRRQDRDQPDSNFNNVYLKNLSEETTDEYLNNVFGEFGTITSVAIMRDADGKSKGFGFVNFEDPEAARESVEKLNGHEHAGKAWVVNKAQKKSEREAELRQQREQNQAKYDKFAGCNLYIKNLDDSVGDDEFRSMFQEHGSITSSKVMKDESGASKGWGFVAFSSPEEATRAITEMNGKIPAGGSKPLYVALAQRKEDRQARLKAQFHAAQMGPMGGMPHPGMPMFPGGGPGMPGPGMMFPGAPGGMMPPGGMGYPAPPGMPGMMPGMRPGMQGMPSYYGMPMMQAQMGQHQGHSGGRGRGRGGRGGNQGYPGGRGGGRNTMKNHAAPVPAAPPAPKPPQASATLLTQQLHSATPDNRRMILGEALYPLIMAIEPAAAAKVTGMLLEMDQSEVLLLIDSPDQLRLKVAEAIKVLKEAGQDPANDPEPGSEAPAPAADTLADEVKGLSVA
eukprot:CAMPEP_0177791148 /NCGR_PEP_ID=MMETSP0491_2-20121128/23769_1 /TAXON_ID=63592 /ORGANISM="Tetraselmis chuii, Strain PLY429" /LENGTH=647 /DNA_ID=CAMNT_0019313341 /DNA_START=109 /DNA_END=2052 /DNA_ORIENTATION=-